MGRRKSPAACTEGQIGFQESRIEGSYTWNKLIETKACLLLKKGMDSCVWQTGRCWKYRNSILVDIDMNLKWFSENDPSFDLLSPCQSHLISRKETYVWWGKSPANPPLIGDQHFMSQTFCTLPFIFQNISQPWPSQRNRLFKRWEATGPHPTHLVDQCESRCCYLQTGDGNHK